VTAPEVRRLLIRLIWAHAPDPAAVLHWSRWRRRHQARAELSHYRRRGELHHHPNHRMITDSATKDQPEVLL
jgi:hypothetical protein